MHLETPHRTKPYCAVETVWTSAAKATMNSASIAWALAEFVIAHFGPFASEFGFLSVVPALIHQVPQVRTLNSSAPRPCCDFILASISPVATHARGRFSALKCPSTRYF
jgi:hypothetical protein